MSSDPGVLSNPKFVMEPLHNLANFGFETLRPDRVEQFGQPRPALGQLLALDRIHGPQVGVVVVEYDGPFCV